MITSSVFTRLGRHKPVKLRVLREFVDERNERGTDFHQSATGFHIRDIRKLRVRDIQQFRKLHAVGRSLIEHNNELGVCEHRSRGVALKQVVHVLRNTGTESAVFTNALPKSEQEVGAVLVLEQQIDLIYEDERVLAFGSVRCDAVQNTVIRYNKLRKLKEAKK